MGVLTRVMIRNRNVKDFNVSKYRDAPSPMSFSRAGISRWSSKLTKEPVDADSGQCSAFDTLG